IVSDLGLVDPRRGDFHLRWNSPALDAGDPAAPLDFDLTRADVGWREVFASVELSSTHAKLPVGWYLIPEQGDITVTYSGAMPPGTIFRLGAASRLTIVGRARSGRFHIGAPDGERSAFVGLTRLEVPDFAEALTLSGTRDEELVLRGTFFHGLPTRLVFAACRLEFSPATFASQNSVLSALGNPDTRIEFVDCTGELAGFDFRTAPLPASQVALVRSGVHLRHCHFGLPREQAGHALLVDGSFPGRSIEVTDCSFAGGSPTSPSLNLQDTALRLERNRFEECRFRAISSCSSFLDMSHHANNSFKSGVSSVAFIEQLIFLHNSTISIKDGANNFIYNGVMDLPLFSFISHLGDGPTTGQVAPDATNYTGNFWGSSCSTPVQAKGRIPAWADPGAPLTRCDDPIVGQGRLGDVSHPAAP
ncbi:MAG: hypothetical protein Q8O14_11395, partial [bacterium]|nr:hypothetical protein [bacterium]